MYCQQPWWSEYKGFVDAMSRESMVLAESKKYADVLVIHPQTTAWALYDGVPTEKIQNKEIEKLNNELLSLMKTLEQKHIMYHLGDETIMERHAKVQNGKLVIGKQSYSYIIDSACEILLPKTKELLDEFKAQGGQVVTDDALAANDVCDNGEITYVKRVNDEYTVNYFVNTSKERKTANIKVTGKKLDIYTGELVDFAKNYEFEPWGSLMVIEGDNNTSESQKPDIIRLNGEFKISKPIQNTITLDRCDYYFDGVLQEKDGYVLNICERANALERPAKIHQDYHIKMSYLPEELFLVCETPEKFEIKVNGETINKAICGYYIDKSFKKLDISKYIQIGENIISFDCDFVQSEEFYENRRKSFIFESEKNKLVYDMEIEAIYLLGDFSLKTDGKWEQLDKNAVRYSGSFEISEPKDKINIKNIEQQGYPFFSGEMSLVGEIDIEGKNPVLELDLKGINAVRVKIGNKEKVMLTDNRLSLADFGVSGKTKCEITLINNLRNILGPHHLKEGESYFVGPRSFFKEKCVWSANAESWIDDYCFLEMGI